MSRVIFALFLAVCCNVYAQDERIREATKGEISAVKDAMESRLKDPDSARYSSVVVSTKSSDADMYTICGLVNSKNSYGGYTGSSWFYGVLIPDKSDPSVIILRVDEAGPDDNQVAATMCEQKLFGDE